jgi:hypothetical protein
MKKKHTTHTTTEIGLKYKHNQFATLNQQNAQYCSLDIYSTILHWIFVHVSIQKGSSSGNETKGIRHKTKYFDSKNFKVDRMYQCIIYPAYLES